MTSKPISEKEIRETIKNIITLWRPIFYTKYSQREIDEWANELYALFTSLLNQKADEIESLRKEFVANDNDENLKIYGWNKALQKAFGIVRGKV